MVLVFLPTASSGGCSLMFQNVVALQNCMGRIIAEPYVEHMTYANLVGTVDFWRRTRLTVPSLSRPGGAVPAANRITVCQVLASKCSHYSVPGKCV